MSWKANLKNYLKGRIRKRNKMEEKLERGKSEVKRFFDRVVEPAFRDLKKELEKYIGDEKNKLLKEVRKFRLGKSSALLNVKEVGRLEFTYILDTELSPVSTKQPVVQGDCYIEQDGKKVNSAHTESWPIEPASSHTRVKRLQEEIKRDFTDKWKTLYEDYHKIKHKKAP